MHFAPDSEDTLEFIVALGNTHPSASRSGEDELATPEQLGVLLTENVYSGRIDGDEQELREVQETRDLLRRLWSLDRDDAARQINLMLAEAKAMPYLTRHDHFDWHLHATSNDAPLAERIRVEAALALADMIRSDETGRMRVCEADDCTGLLLDLSRNGSKRFCSVRCGNRMNQLAFRERAQER
ncbi:putative RNA-binding Zn ribbon-like protein [Leifsonia sp. AK011]|uniref:CGNR zinc finger domain-containing protein n=1 Tax=Leifsonia sp. AK011 TaxID=2723075 RepID=UPI0015C9D9D8|nr:CGNR zinc finger domain-containing protein [Leifsonia sp. AK011]NYF11198.1 putative RNA-binding Zn ribbon-like protein [Leifsonia sp. AK011]